MLLCGEDHHHGERQCSHPVMVECLTSAVILVPGFKVLKFIELQCNFCICFRTSNLSRNKESAQAPDPTKWYTKTTKL
eukprot:2546570-Amphidinium_carterae.1